MIEGSDATAKCNDCGHEFDCCSKGDTLPACPKCGSTSVVITPDVHAGPEGEDDKQF
jgi:Zn finger protein HypA/HybF involved in hydrogenase expression